MDLFGFKRKKGEVLNHWIAFVERFGYPPTDFYAAVEKELAALKVPSMDMTRVEFAEGGPLSDKRVYLRMIRERLIFDTCAAPFGTGFFFSCRSVYIPAVVKLWHALVLALLFFGIYVLLASWLGVVFAGIALAGLLLAIAQVFRNTIALGLSDLDAALIKTPVIGPVYERWFRKETYFRTDTRLLYLDTIPKIIKRLAEEATAANGVKLTQQYEQAPILGELYKPVPVREEPK
ncbi:MAG TPA: hypothetical protein VNL17_11530 [Verrucomicrobiae bacterium]|nr:hypothetical protein [Verrucomicrobiae bacterium]